MNDPVIVLADEILRALGSPADEHIQGQTEWLQGGGARIIAQQHVASIIRRRMAEYLGRRLMEYPL